MTREEFDAALDRYVLPNKRWGHADRESMCWGKNEGQECCLEQKPVRDFLFDLMTNGIGALDKMRSEPDGAITYRPPSWHIPLRADASRYDAMNREVQELKVRRDGE